MNIEEVNDFFTTLKIRNPENIHENIPIFIIGSPRSGTTLIYQALVSYFDIEYPTNFIAKFWGNPIIGYIMQQELYAHDRKTFISKFSSHHGHSENSNFEPHEFGYFWSRWFGHSKSHYTDKNYKVSDELKTTVNSLLSISNKNWIFKNLTLSLKIPLIKIIFPNAKFIYVKRSPFSIAQSLYKGRLDRFGDDKKWWSLIPKEIEQINKLFPKEQVAAQVYCITKQIENDLNNLNNDDYITVKYEDYIDDKESSINAISKFIELPFKYKQMKIENNKNNLLNINIDKDIEINVNKYFGEKL